MASLAQLCVGALAVVLLTDYVAPPGSALSLRPGSAAAVSNSLHNVNRAGKADRLPAGAAAGDRNIIASVEVIGLRNAAVIYRDRDGRLLFRSDPVSNATVIAKDVVLPEVTIRDSSRSKVAPVPVESGAPAPPPPAPILDGCDPAFSPLAVKANVAGRCVASRDVPQRLASVLR